MFKKAILFLCLSTSLLFAQASVIDQTRLESLVSTQSKVLLRVKAVQEYNPSAEAVSVSKTADGATVKTALDTDSKQSSEDPKSILRLGTGFFISGDGLFVTNATVVHDAKRIWYELNGTPYLAELVGMDISTNMALLRAKTMPSHIDSVNLSDSVGLPSVGSILLRMSLPMEFGPTPSLGIVQGAETQLGLKAFPTRYLRVQLATGPGEAGAPVFDTQGRFVGMTVAVLPEIGATFILPARAIAWIRDGLLANSGKMAYSYFGFHAEEDHSDAEGLRLLVSAVDESSPAQQAGLKSGDVIVTVAKRLCHGLSDLRDAAFYTQPGQYLDLTVRRAGVEVPIAIQAKAQ